MRISGSTVRLRTSQSAAGREARAWGRCESVESGRSGWLGWRTRLGHADRAYHSHAPGLAVRTPMDIQGRHTLPEGLDRFGLGRVWRANELRRKVETITEPCPIHAPGGFDSSSLAGLVLLGATGTALAIGNSDLNRHCENFLRTDREIRVGGNSMLHKPLLHWINDGLMAIFSCLSAWRLSANFSSVI